MVRSIVRAADFGGTFVFAIEGGLAARAAGLDPIGVLTLAFLTALGGGIIRDLLIGARRPAAIEEWRYAALVLVASAATLLFHTPIGALSPWLLTTLDALGLALFAVAGTQKALEHGVNPLSAVFLGTVGGVGGGALRDVALNQVPSVLRTDIYATAAIAAAIVVVTGRALGVPPRVTAVTAGLLCFALRMAAVTWHWHLPVI